MDSVLVLSAVGIASGPDSVAAEAAPPAGAWFAIDQRNPLLHGLCDSPSPLSDFSPIVLYGPAGCGKSSLAQVLAEVHSYQCRASQRAAGPSLTIAIDEFDRRIRHALLVGDLNEALAVWEKPDCLILEEYQRFAGGPFVDQMLVQLLELRREAGCLTIFVGQQAPWLGCKFSSRMQSRLSHGLSLEVHQPGEPAVRKIAEWTAQSLGLNWEPVALDCAVKSNLGPTVLVRFLRRFAQSEKGPRSIGEDAVQKLLAQSQQVQPIEPRLVLGMVARYFRLRLPDLVGPSRRQSLVKARGIAICLLRHLCGLKWQTIAEITGRKDHSTVLHAYAKTLELLEQDQTLAEAYRLVRQKLSARQPIETCVSKSR